MRPRKYTYGSAIALAVAIGLMVKVASGQADAPPADEAALEKSLAGAARETVDALQERMRAGEPLTPTFCVMFMEWSRRAFFAELTTAEDRDARVQSARAHLDRVELIQEAINANERGDTSPVFLLQTRYFVKEAELWVAKATKGKPINPVLE